MGGLRKAALLLGIAVLSLLAGEALRYFTEPGQTVCINEICSSNKRVAADSYGECSDYIELYNASDSPVSLSGWYLTDDTEDRKKAALPDVTIEPGAYLVLFANGRDDSEDSLPFKISAAGGETILLTDSEGNTVDSVAVPELRADTVYARRPDGSDTWAVLEASPGVSNDGSAAAREATLEEPVFSVEGGFYDEAFYLEIQAGEGETVYYTLDGSEPTAQSEVYTESILIEDASANPNVYNAIQNVTTDWLDYTPTEENVDKGTVIRAIAVDEEGNFSEITTATYFVGLDAYEDADVLSLVADPEELFGEDGIYVTGKEYDEWYLSGSDEEEPTPNYEQKGALWEIDCNLEMFESGGSVLNQAAGLRIQGGSSRASAKKRFSVYAREEYSGSDYFDYEILEGKQLHSFALRSGFANVAMQELVEERSVGTQSAREVVVFLNGEYWYTTYIQEKYSKYYLSEEYGVDMEDVAILRNYSVTGSSDSSMEAEFAEMMEFFQNGDFSTEEAFEEACEKIDMQSYIDFMVTNIYLCNMDMSDRYNQLTWRTCEDDGTEYGDGKFRWLLYDLDYVETNHLDFYEVGNMAELNSFTAPIRFDVNGSSMDEMILFSALRDNESFREQFVTSFLDMANTCFSLEHATEVLEKWGEDIHWHNDFFLLRFDYAAEYLAEEFSLTGTLEELTLSINDTEGGSVQLNTCTPDLSDGSWSGKYYTDYPVTLTAVAASGYRFVGWTGSVTGSEETITVDLAGGGAQIEAVFEKIE
ncbi:MAG: CotH kinase family protein [Lachnospiraceae bacterium]|nr:CotH kinase family protein [Lachnospiraceae bacterium]